MAISAPPANGYDFIFDAVPPTAEIPDDRTAEDYRNVGVMLVRENGRGARLEVNPDPGVETTEDPVYGPWLIHGMGFTERHDPQGYGYGRNIDTLTPGVILPGGKITQLDIQPSVINGFAFRDSVRFRAFGQSSLFFFGGKCPVAVSGGSSATGSFTHDFANNDLSFGIDSAVVFDGKICAAVDDGTGHLATSTNGVDWVVHDGTGPLDDIRAFKLQVVYWESGGLGAYRLIAKTSNNGFKTCTGDPTVAGNWTGEVLIDGMQENGIQSMPASARHVFFGGPDGLFTVDGLGRAHNLVNYAPEAYVIGNFAASIFYDGSIHANFGNGIVRIPVDGNRNDRPEHYGVGYGTANGSPIAGYAAPPCAWNGYIIWPIYNPSTLETHIMLTYRNGDGNWIWHGSFATLAGQCTHTRIDSPSGGQTNLWVCIEGDPPEIHSVSMPFSGSAYQELVNGGSHRFSETGSIYFADGWNAPTSMRTHYRSDVYADRLDGIAQVGVYANRDHLGWELQGNATSSPRTSFIPATVEESAFRIDYRVDLQGQDDNPPVLRAFQPRATVKREQNKVWSLLLDVGHGVMMLNGDPDTQDPAISADILWNLQESPNGPIRISNRRGDIMFGEVLPGLKDSLSENADGAWDHIIPVRVRELWIEWRWDDGVPWDSGRFWS